MRFNIDDESKCSNISSSSSISNSSRSSSRRGSSGSSCGNDENGKKLSVAKQKACVISKRYRERKKMQELNDDLILKQLEEANEQLNQKIKDLSLSKSALLIYINVYVQVYQMETFKKLNHHHHHQNHHQHHHHHQESINPITSNDNGCFNYC